MDLCPNGRPIYVGTNFGQSKSTAVKRNFKPSNITVVDCIFEQSKTTIVDQYFGPSNITVVDRNFGQLFVYFIFLCHQKDKIYR